MNAPTGTGSGSRTGFHLAQVNIARPLAALNSPVMQGFTEAIGAMNALAERSPGFVWRLVGSPEADAEAARVFEDPTLLVTLSVWESVESLRAYAMQSAHGSFLRRRVEWFHPATGPSYAVWWIPQGTLPSLAEAHQRLAHLAQHGPTPEAFGFKESFPPPGSV